MYCIWPRKDSLEVNVLISAPLRDARDGFLHGSLGGQLARVAAVQGDAMWYNGLQIVILNKKSSFDSTNVEPPSQRNRSILLFGNLFSSLPV